MNKPDKSISIIGEVASDTIAERMIQMGKVASVYTLFSHHSNTTSEEINEQYRELAYDNGYRLGKGLESVGQEKLNEYVDNKYSSNYIDGFMVGLGERETIH